MRRSCVLAVMFAWTAAAADPPVGTRDIVITSPGKRSTKNVAVLVGLAGGAVVLGGIGYAFQRDAEANANAVNATTFTGQAWSTSLQHQYDRANASNTASAVMYAAGGAVLVGAIVVLLATEPPEQRTVIHPHYSVAPTPGGAMLGGAWSF